MGVSSASLAVLDQLGLLGLSQVTSSEPVTEAVTSPGTVRSVALQMYLWLFCWFVEHDNNNYLEMFRLFGSY